MSVQPLVVEAERGAVSALADEAVEPQRGPPGPQEAQSGPLALRPAHSALGVRQDEGAAARSDSASLDGLGSVTALDQEEPQEAQQV